jgi:hypothetical protein
MKDLTKEFEALKKSQLGEAEKISAQAGLAASRAVSPTTIAAAVRAVASVAADRGRGAVGEPSFDLADVRADRALSASLSNDIRLAQRQTELLIVGALELGYRSQIDGTPLGAGVSMTYTPDAQTTKELQAYPIQGETSGEHAEWIAGQLRRDCMRATGAPLVGLAVTPAVALLKASDDHSGRVASICSEAYFAGVQAGLIAAAGALVGK